MAIYISKIINPDTPPAIITLAEAKTHLKVDSEDENDLINGLIGAAIQDAENYAGIDIIQSIYEIETYKWINHLEIKLSPVRVVESIKYFDANNEEQTQINTTYQLKQKDRYAHEINYKDPDNLPVVYDKVDAIKITVKTGFEATKTPEAIKAAIYLILGDLYENREDKPHGLPSRSKALLKPYRFYY